MERRSSTLSLGVGLVGEAQVRRWIVQGWRQKARSSAWRMTEGEKARGHRRSVGKWLGEPSWWRWCTVSSWLILLRREREGHLIYSCSTAPAPHPTHSVPPPAPLRQKVAPLGVAITASSPCCPSARARLAPYHSQLQKTSVELPSGIRLGPTSQGLLEHSSCLLETLWSQIRKRKV